MFSRRPGNMIFGEELVIAGKTTLSIQMEDVQRKSRFSRHGI